MEKLKYLRSAALILFWGITIPFLILACKSGKSVENNIKQEYTQTTNDSINTARWRDTWRHDSIYIHDSVSVMMRADTVFVDRWHKVYERHNKSDTDTLKQYIQRTCYITKTITRTLYVKTKAKTSTRKKIVIGLLLAFLIPLVYKNRNT